MRVIAVANQKGGCGKTTTSINLAACLAYLGKKVALIDMDPQGHSTCGLGVQLEKGEKTLYDILSDSFGWCPPFSELLREVRCHLFVVPSNGVLSILEEELAHCPNRDQRLKEALSQFGDECPDFDYGILDCPPNLGVLTFNAFEAADEIIVPVEPSFFSLHGLAKISETLHMINSKRECPVGIHALLTIFDSDLAFSQEIYEEVKAHFGEKLFHSIIHQNIVLKEAACVGQSIVDYAPDSEAFKDYFRLAVEFLKREWNRIYPETELGWRHIVHRRYGPRMVSGGILFQAVSPHAHSVEIAGDFNNWIAEPMVRRNGNGLWQKVIPTQRGNYRYKFIVDGEWQVDPYQHMQRTNEFGTTDSYLELV